MFSKLFLLVPIILMMTRSITVESAKYQRTYYENGRVKSEGWFKGDTKIDYWKFYHKNGKIAEQGHYRNNNRINYWYFYNEKGTLNMEGHYTSGKMANWWLFYDQSGKVNHKCQLSDGIRNGYCLQYNNEKLTSAEKYKNGRKIKEWFSLRSFKRENKLSDLK